MNEIYLDNSATTKVCSAAISKMVETMEKNYGNPSSLHSKGFEAEKELKLARQALSDVLCADSDEIIFTSGGTESNNMAIFGAVKLNSRYGKHIVTTAIEHPSVLNPIKELEKEGFKVTYLTPDKNGNVSVDDVYEAITPETILVSMMMVNNETGAIMPIYEAEKAIKEKAPHALFHVDCVQGFGKLSLDLRKIKIDLLSASAHKIHGPKGIGLLYIRKGVRLPARVFGGGQEKGLRSGTEGMPLITGFAAAAKELEAPNKALLKMQELNNLARKLLLEIPDVIIQSPENALPYIINFSLPGIRSEIMLHYLSSFGVYVSSGSACAGGEKSHVLSAMNLPNEQIDSSIRVSFSQYTTEEEIRFFAQKVKDGSETLMRTSKGRNKRR